jgi:hypothetical protein
MSELMQFRRVTVQIGLWEDAEAFGWNNQRIVSTVLHAFPVSTSVGVTDSVTNEYEVGSDDE